MSPIIKTVLTAGFAAAIQFSPAHAVEFGLFGDVSYSDSGIDGDNSAFALGGLDFYATTTISETSRGFVEFVLENTREGFIIDLERLWISHTFEDEFSLAAGRFHSPLGKWNRTYHHGSIVQDTVSRPFFLDFEDGAAAVLPTHVVGLMSTGDFTFENSEISYELSLANGPSIDSSAGFNPTATNRPEIDINNISDPNGAKSLALRVIYKPDAFPVQTGLFMMNNTIAESAMGAGLTTFGDTLVEQTIVGFDFSYENDNFDVLAEYYNFSNTNKTGVTGSYEANAYFVQLGYRLTEKLKTVLRYEDLSFDANDNYFRLLGTRQASHSVVALRYDVDEANALKLEVHKAKTVGIADSTSVVMQWAFLIP
jgi:hypothetical protein